MRKKTSGKKTLSIKLKLTLWFTSFMVLTAALCLGLILLVSGRVAENEAFNILSLTARANLTEVSLEDGTLTISPDFQFYSNDVYFLIYNKNGAVLSGQAPPSFSPDAPLENGVSKFVSGTDGSADYYVLDFWIPSGWDDGLWLRGVLRSPDGRQMTGNIFTLFAIVLPFLILLAAAGGWLIARRALAPISRIADAAESISRGQDLSLRTGIPEGRDEVGRLAGSFDRMFARLEQSFEAEKQFTSDASHELRTPTAVILAQCSYAKKHGSTVEDYREAISVIHRQAEKMSLLISRLLDITRLDLGTQKLKRESADLSEMARILCEEQDTGARGISLETRIQDGVTGLFDPFLISRVIINLLDNARKYGRENGHIRLSLAAEEQEAVLTVEDDGIGIPPEEQDRIWQRFYQVNSSREGGSGLGLGLSMVRQIVDLHGGSISVESRPGEGSRFIVRLPL
ncbi:MAG TPA: HAMP domain-containing histidine kinase [Candidatus Lachnoclostridium stercorigallinarum]|uniref:histidine kinase n=1 Tax=Candidatus Lachnoclostridium stercorigallinarum TaxID=2838634 RepID=A0A9D2K5W3_9FIRM|nr:HAMP domain-containing histidine kinase [Candidatus Lachnoclostridium stercorigallinarum]